MSAADKSVIRLDYTGPGTLVLPLGLGDTAEVQTVKSGAGIDLSEAAWKDAQKLPNVRKLLAAEQLRASRPV